jgi:ADP-ribose pyrophosphatase YjhB (NUDIX family)
MPMPTTNREPDWLLWARELQALAQSGLAYSESPYDRERYERLRAIAVDILARHGDTPFERVRDLFAEERGYATPKVDVRGVVFRDDRVLLVRESQDGGRWTLPGGWADVNETPREGVEREIREESGYEARAVKLLACYDRAAQGHEPPYPHHVFKLFFLCELTGGAPADSHETSGASFFAEDGIPELSKGRTTARQLHRFFEHLRNPALPTDFD